MKNGKARLKPLINSTSDSKIFLQGRIKTLKASKNSLKIGNTKA